MGPAKYPSKKVTFEDTLFRFVHKLSRKDEVLEIFLEKKIF
jgi:hypothetical protein